MAQNVPRIDAHVHVYAKASSAFPREVTDTMGPDDEAPVELLLEQMGANDIDRAVLVQIGGKSLDHHAYLQHCLSAFPDRFRGIGLVPEPQNPAEHMDHLLEDGLVVGFRLFEIGGPLDPLAPMNVTEFDTYPVWEHAAKRDCVIWLYPSAAEAHLVPFLVDAFPQVRVVFNHMLMTPGRGKFTRDADGRPRIETTVPPQSRYNTVGLYQYENVCVKLSGQYAFSKDTYPYEDLATWHGRLVSTFGADHCMWATDFPFILKEPGYARQTRVIEELLPELSKEERALVMGGAAEKWIWRENL